MKKLIFAIYIVCIHIILFSILIKPELVDKATYKLGIYPKPSHYERLFSRHLLKNARIKEGDIVFLGDSIIEKADVKQITPKGHNLGISKDWTNGLANRIPFYRNLDKTRLLVIHIGVNDLSLQKGEVATSFSRYQKMLTLLPSNVPTVLNSILPLAKSKENADIDNAKIEQFNQMIKQYASKYPNYYYLDIASQMKDADGGLKPAYHVGDYTHLNKQGYQVFTQVIRGFIEQHQFLSPNKLFKQN